MKNRYLSTAAALLLAIPAAADEGMWMVNTVSRALVGQMQDKGLKLDGNDIYDADRVSLKDAIVSLDFACTGSMVSPMGLLITNHHCAYSDIASLSTDDHNYLEDGFWAYQAGDEIPIPGKSVQFLKRMIDVTDEVNALIDGEKAQGRPFGMRRISHLMEKKYFEETGLEASLSSMWAGSRYYLALYKVYRDVRLVAAPPVCAAAFGGDVDNWEWPQHKCDFAMYRVYAGPDGEPADYSESNVPMTPDCWLHISTKGIQPGDFTMVMGYPGRTDRYSSSAKVNYLTTLSLPISNKVRAERMSIMAKWMDTSPAIRLKYADRYFSLSNVAELQEGEVQCCKRFKVIKAKKAVERKLKRAEDKETLRALDEAYRAIRTAEKNSIWYRETLIRGSEIDLIATRLKNHKSPLDMEKEYSTIDMRVEKDLFGCSIRNYFENVDSCCWGPYQVNVRNMFLEDGAVDYDAMTEYLWTDDYMTKDDRIFKFLTDVSVSEFNSAIDKAQGTTSVSELGKRFTRGLYRYRLEKGITQYPDANSTMRLSYGTVGSFRRDGKLLPWCTLSGEILEKETPGVHDFTLRADWRDALTGTDVAVDFITDNDITGGNSGSPVLDAGGRLVGLAFDGNKESLASDVHYTEGYNKCVCTDIRFVLWTLDRYASLDRVLDELQISEQ